MVAGRNDNAIADALRMLAGSLGQIPQVNAGNRNGDDDEYRTLGNDAQRVQFGTHMLEKEAEDLWGNIAQRFEEEGIQITWDLFHDAFLENYFPEDFRGKKDVEFLEMKQGNGIVAEYAAKFQELIKYCPHYSTTNAERSKCLKFVNGLRHDIKKAIGYQKITHFAEMSDQMSRHPYMTYESAVTRISRIFGIPCHAWNIEFFMEFANWVGRYVCLDENTL
ncbi:uncharacterized protein LOC131618968 [Vicia villosa]|uniref:uncharacterized protein LOC131618968 n=1 Tax=Vicia villosa TaxID=3911 RepID=UPI00273C7D2C|nr:uncharacterized protein LOC131618968 [Vicia villosa]